MPSPAMPDAEITLGFDFGTRRIGVAVGNAITGRAQALCAVVNRDTPDWTTIAAAIKEWRPAALIVGLPLADDGGDQAMTVNARGFMDALAERFALPVHAVDERFSTIEAAGRLRAARASGSRGKRLTKGDADAMAAQVILESWLAGSGAENVR